MRRDRGAVDTSVEMLISLVALLGAVVIAFDTVAHWHTRTVVADAASDGVRAAAAWGGGCATALAVAQQAVERQVSGWADEVEIDCADGPLLRVEVAATTPSVLAGAARWRARAVAVAPIEE